MSDRYIITIDGPAGSGKSTAARGLARRLGVRYFNSGALYRAIVTLAVDAGLDLDDTEAVLGRLESAPIEVRYVDGLERVMVDGRDVTESLFRNEISRLVYKVADPPAIRREVARLARALNADRSFVTEGRDQGTEVFPEAQVKFYLDARPEVRARRRWRELRERGETVTLEDILDEMRERDALDRGRKVGALRPAADAIRVDNSELDPEGTVDRLVVLATERLSRTPGK